MVTKSLIDTDSFNKFANTFCISPIPNVLGTSSSISAGCVSFTLSIKV